MDTKPEKKNRLSRLLRKREKGSGQPTVPPDSAYASSETPSGEAPKDTSNSTPDIVPVEKNSEMANIDQGRNLAVKPSTGEVLDQDTGELVTVITTTTTTTTTTTRKPGKPPAVSKDVKKEVQETTPTAVPSNSAPSEMPASTAITDSRVPDRTSSRPPRDSPPIPTRSAARKSGEYTNRQSQASSYPAYDENLPPPTGTYFGGGTGNTPPASPSKHNFSYPSRNRNSIDPDGSGAGGSKTDQPQHHNKSTMNDLRAAAKGIHGVGETLRGTFNQAIDQNFPRKNANKAAAASAKNEEVLARGRTEMGNIPTTMPTHQRTKTSEQTVPGSWAEDEPSAEPAAADEMEREQREKQKARSIGKLFKRKHVGAKEEAALRDRKYY